MTDAFVVLTSDEDKYTVLDPEVVGPFESDSAAWAWIERHPRHIGGGQLEPIDGGYAGAVVVSSTVACDPEWKLAEIRDELA